MKTKEIFISQINGVGKVREKKFHQIGIYSVEDLLTLYPRDYIDTNNLKKINKLENDEKVFVNGVVLENIKEIRTKSRVTIYETTIKDDTAILKIKWFNQPFVKYKLKKGIEYLFYGRVQKEKNFVMMNPTFEESEINNSFQAEMKPVYRLTEGLTQEFLRVVQKRALQNYSQYISSIIPEDIRAEYLLKNISDAIYQIHFPKNQQELENAKRTLVFEEFFVLQLQLISIKKNINKITKTKKYKNIDVEIEIFKNCLNFELTNSQKTILKEIFADMDSEKILNRLIQGDVGSGKTVVAAIAILKAALSGYQSAMMAPTEVLAKQHYEELSKMYKDFPIKVSILTGSMTKKEKNEVKRIIQNGETDVVVGTHAIIQSDVEFCNLALAITDEQHRFGVKQRSTISQKGSQTDVIVMSATPIPRTLALISYGDLDISILDEMPKDRIPVETFIIREEKREGLNNFIKENIKEGGQAFVVCPLIEDSENFENCSSVVSLWEEFTKDIFKNNKVGILHGKMNDDDKDQIIGKFASGEIEILVSTTVIEVGVNIPNANIMVIENAEKFGLSQLHQLRGRVGRGVRKSFCFLFNQSSSETSRKRLTVLKDSNDGFFISEKDLKLRGPGDFFGIKQHGLVPLKIANIFSDIIILKEVQKLCEFLQNNQRMDSIIEALPNSDFLVII